MEKTLHMDIREPGGFISDDMRSPGDGDRIAGAKDVFDRIIDYRVVSV